MAGFRKRVYLFVIDTTKFNRSSYNYIYLFIIIIIRYI